MASTFSDLGIELMATGENAGTWGTKTNTNLQIVEKAIAGYVEQAVTSGGTTALSITDGDTTESTSVARHAVIKLTGTISGNSIVTVPDSIEKVYVVVNGTSGSYTVQFKTASGTGVTFGATEKTTKMVFSDGTNIVDTGFALGVAADDISTGDAAVTIGTSTGDITIDSPADIVLDADGADIFLKDAGTTYGSLTNSSGNLIVKSGTTTAATFSGANVTLAGTVGSGAITSTSTIQGTTITATTAFVPDASDGAALGTSSLEFSDLFLADAAVINLGADQDVTLTHVADTGVLLNGANVIQFRDSGLTIGSNADGDLDVVSDGTAVDSINIESAGGITLDAGTAGSGIIYEDDGTEMARIHNSSSDVILETKVSDKDFLIKGNDGGSTITALTLDMSAAGAATFNDKIIATELDISGNVDVDGTLEADAYTLEGSSFFKVGGTNFTDSVLFGHATSGTLNAAIRNTGVGSGALDALTSGDKNTAIGRNAGGAINTGSRNALLGQAAGQSITSAEQNAIFGDSAMTTNTSGGSYNSALGTGTLASVDNGDYNLAIGWQAGYALTSGTGNVIIGSNADVSSNTGDRQLIISGYDGTTTTTWISGDSSGIVTFADDILIKDDGTIGSASAATAMTIESSGQVNFVGDINVADDVFMSSDSAQFTFGANSEIRLQHVHNAGLQILHTATGDDSTVNLTLATDEADIAVDDVIGILNFQAPSEGTGTDSRLVAASIAAVSEGDFAADNNATKLSFRTAASETASEKMSLSSDGTLTVSHDVILANNSFIQFGDAGENIAGDGTDLTITTSNDFKVDCAGDIVLDADGAEIELQDNGVDFGRFIRQGNDLDIRAMINDGDITFLGSDSDGGGLFTAGTFDMSDAGTLILNHDLVIADGGQIGSASDTDAMAISSGGVVTFSQAPVVPIGGLDIDGATDIGADLADADLFIVDDGAGGTNRKLAASRLTTYINANANFASVGKAIAMAIVFG